MIYGYDARQRDRLKNTRIIAYMTYCANTQHPVGINSFMPIDEINFVEDEDDEEELSPEYVRELIKHTQIRYNKMAIA